MNKIKEGRIIIRNLVYDVNEKHLRNLFSKYGDISEVNIPLNPSTNKSKGFAFVQFANKNHALKAIKVIKTRYFCKSINIFSYNQGIK